MEDDILIDNYLKGLLSEAETESFKERLQTDITFKEKYSLEKQLFNALNEKDWAFSERVTSEVESYKKLLEGDDLQQLKQTLKNTNSEYNSEATKPSSRRLYYYLAAASIIVLLGFQLFYKQDIANQELYTNYVDLNELPSLVSRSDEAAIRLAEAQMFFEEKKYKEALSIFQATPDDINNKGVVTIYEGLALTELEMYKKAEDVFNTLIDSDLLDAEKGYWYKALLFLKQDRIKDAKTILKKIIEENQFNTSKAKELLKDLN